MKRLVFFALLFGCIAQVVPMHASITDTLYEGSKLTLARMSDISGISEQKIFSSMKIGLGLGVVIVGLQLYLLSKFATAVDEQLAMTMPVLNKELDIVEESLLKPIHSEDIQK